MKLVHESKVRMVPIDRILVVNSRSRGKAKFKTIVANISNIGLKKPLTVARTKGKDGWYDLVCGEGRLLAMKALGQTEVPVLIVEGSKEDLLLSGLAENVARRLYTTIDSARQIGLMRDRGDKPVDIAKKVDLNVSYVNGILRLLKHGEERLLVAVEHRRIPLSLAVSICGSDNQQVQQALTEAYDRGELRGQALVRAKRLIDQRQARGKRRHASPRRTEAVTATTLVKVYKDESARQQIALHRARVCETRLRFITSAVKKLLSDESLINLLRAEGLATLPQCLAEGIQKVEVDRAE